MELSDRTRSGYPARQAITTRWADQDSYGHVNNVVYYSYADTAVNGYLMEATSLDTRELEAIGLVAESQCRFRRELRFPGEIVVGLGVTRLGDSSITYELGIFQGSSQEAAGVLRFVHVYVDRNTRKSTSIPSPIREAAKRLLLVDGH